MKIIIVGRKSFVIGFEVAGFQDVYIVTQQQEFNTLVEKFLSSQDIGIVICEDHFLSSIPLKLKKELGKRAIPVFIPINPKGDHVVGESIESLMKRALGFEIKG